jgi:lysophospholipase L1-like esterase
VALLCGTLLLLLGALEGWHRHLEGNIVFPALEPGRGFKTRPLSHHTNRYGFLEREIAPLADPEIYRVVVLGDSVTWGLGSPAEAWPRVAESTINQKNPEKSYQFLNFAHYGYDIEAVLATWKYAASAWKPNLVIYGMYTNDLVPNTVIYLGNSSYPVWIGATPGVFPRWLSLHSAMARRLEGAWMVRKLEEKPNLGWFTLMLVELKRVVEASGAELVVVGLVPHVLAGHVCELRQDWCDRQQEWGRLQQGVVEGMGLWYIPVLPMWNKTGMEAFFGENKQDGDHPSIEGARVVGEGVGQAIVDRPHPPPEL